MRAQEAGDYLVRYRYAIPTATRKDRKIIDRKMGMASDLALRRNIFLSVIFLSVIRERGSVRLVSVEFRALFGVGRGNFCLPEFLSGPMVLKNFVALFCILQVNAAHAFVNPVEKTLRSTLSDPTRFLADLHVVGSR